MSLAGLNYESKTQYSTQFIQRLGRKKSPYSGLVVIYSILEDKIKYKRRIKSPKEILTSHVANNKKNPTETSRANIKRIVLL